MPSKRAKIAATVTPKTANIVVRKPPKKTCSQTATRLKKATLNELTGLSRDSLTAIYRRMSLIREFEEQTAVYYRSGKIRGVTHTYQGQEAVAVGAAWNLSDSDYITSTHRGHGHVLAKGGGCEALHGRTHGQGHWLLQRPGRLNAYR